MDHKQQKQNQTSQGLSQNQPKQKRNQQEESLGVDLDEQEMNGMYGMLETKAEDQM